METNNQTEQPKKEVNILLLAMSTLSKNPKESIYCYDNEKDEKGKYIGQLEPIVKYLTKDLEKEMHELYVLNTKETKEPISDDTWEILKETVYNVETKPSAFEYFKERCGVDKNNIKDINVDSVENAVYEISNKIQEHVLHDEKVHIYIDIHGGLRDTFTVVDAVMMLIKKMNNVDIAGIYTVEYKGKGIIKECTERFNIFDFVSGINEFLNFGRSDSLVEYNSNIKANKIKNKNDDVDITKYLIKNVHVKDIDFSSKYTNSNDIKKFAKEIEDNGLKNPIVILESNKNDETDKNNKPHKLLIGNKRLYTYRELLKKDSIEAYVAKGYDDALVYLTNKISDGILLNRTNNFQDNLQDLSELLELKDKNNDASFYDAVSSLIKDNYIVEINGNKYNLLDKKDVDYFPAQLQWCINKKHYQQALVLIENRTAGVLCDQDILITNEEEYTKMSKESDVFVEWVNYRLFTYFDRKNDRIKKYVFKKFKYPFNNIEIFEDEGGDYIGNEKLIDCIRNQFENVTSLPKTYNQWISNEKYKDNHYPDKFIPVNKKFINNDEFLNDLYVLMFTYYGLKKYRNTVAHPNKDINKDLSIGTVEKWIQFYIDIMTAFISNYGNKIHE